MNTIPLITAVVVNHNYGRYLGECLDSVLEQSYPSMEIIVVDDGSTDNSLEILQSYKDRTLLIQQENRGVSAARNVGLAKSKGEWIAFLDSDDAWRPEKLQKQSNYFTQPTVGMVFCGIEFTDDSGRCLGSARPSNTGNFLSQLVTFTSPPIGGSAAVIRSECLRNLGGFDEQLSTAADLDMWIRIAARYEICAVSAPLVKYRCHSTSMHLNVRLFESDNHRLLTNVFSNPSFASVHHLRRQSLGRFHMILAGSYSQQGGWGRAVRCALKGLLYSPHELTHLLGMPLRALRRLITRCSRYFRSVGYCK